MSFTEILNQETGRLFRMRIIQDGDRYGRNMASIHEGSPVVEFYDAKNAFESDPDGNVLGQFVSRYRIDTLLGDDGWTTVNIFEQNSGLDLCGGVDAWVLDAAAMADVEIALLNAGHVSRLSSDIAIEKQARSAYCSLEMS